MIATQDAGVEPAARTIAELYRGLVANLPLIGIAIVVTAVGLVLAAGVAAALRRAMGRTHADPVAADFSVRIARLLFAVGAVLLGLAIAGVQVGPALAGLGIAGLAVAFAVQGILENFIAGIILLVRRPFRAGDQIRTNDFEGTVSDIDMRVTRLITYAGELILIPNRDVYTQPLTNLTRRGKRRTTVVVGIDYRDDHDAAREVLRRALVAVDGVLDEPAADVLLCELGDSSVNFELRYWTLPDITSVLRTRDRVLSAAKTAVEEAGMTIPWPLRTLVVDGPVRVRTEPD